MRILWEERGRRYTASFRGYPPEEYNLTRKDIRILSILDRPLSLKEIAEKMNTSQQAVFYHLKKLIKIGIIQRINIGGVSRYVRPVDAVGVVFNRRAAGGSEVPQIIQNFFAPFIDSGVWDAPIVVGVPDPHGVFLQRARDGHYVGALGFFLGKFYSFRGFPVRVDTDILMYWRDINAVLVGGVVSNVVSYELIEERGVFFDVKRPWMLKGRKNYTEENVGVIARINNGDRSYLLLAGVSALGTKSAIFALIHGWESLLPHFRGPEYYWIVAGVDRNGDGQIDDFTLLERGVPNEI